MQRVNQTYHFENCELSVIRSERKTISLSVSGGVVTLRVPLYLGEGDVKNFLQKYRTWIENKLGEAPQKLSLRDGDWIKIFSQSYEIRTGRAGFVGEGLYLKAENREEHLRRILKAAAREKMTEITDEIAREHGFLYDSIRITSARGRWGACTQRGVLSYSFRVCFLPLEAARYVAVHELCHTRVMNHSQSFWAEVERVLPNYKSFKKILKNSPAMSYL